MLYQLISAPAKLRPKSPSSTQHSPVGPVGPVPLELAADFCKSSPLISGRPSKSRGCLIPSKLCFQDPKDSNDCRPQREISGYCRLKLKRWNTLSNDDESTASATSTLPLMDQIDPLLHLIPQSYGRLAAGAGEFLNFGSMAAPRHLLLGQLL